MTRKYKSLSAAEIVAIRDAVLAGETRKAIAEKHDISPATVGTIGKNFSRASADEIGKTVNNWNKYKKIFNKIFSEKFDPSQSTEEITFSTSDIASAQKALSLEGGNPYDLKYNAKVSISAEI